MEQSKSTVDIACQRDQARQAQMKMGFEKVFGGLEIRRLP